MRKVTRIVDCTTEEFWEKFRSDWIHWSTAEKKLVAKAYDARIIQRIYLPFMKVGEEGWVTERDDDFVSVAKYGGGTFNVRVKKVSDTRFELYYPHDPEEELRKRITKEVVNKVTETLWELLK